MKKILLTSSLGTNIKVDGERFPCTLDNSNNIIDILKKLVTSTNKLVILSSNPNDFERNDLVHRLTNESFKMSGFDFNEIITVDNRNKSNIASIIQDSDIIILSGGHVPTQNNWFREINLKQLLTNYDGIIIGQSAGSMNCADIVYACPELEGEAINPNYNRWIEGLDLTKLKIFPHYEECITQELDGLKLKEDIVLPDSFTHPIYTLNDGSFILINDKEITIHGECSIIQNGNITKLCNNGNIKTITSSPKVY